MKIRAPFKITYDGPHSYRVWGFGLGYLATQFLGWGYNLRGCAARLPLGYGWRSNRRGVPEVA